MKRASAFLGLLLLAACDGSSASPEPVTEGAPALPSEDGCDEAAFEGTFAFPDIEHVGGGPFCGEAAADWNEAEPARTITVWKNRDQSWSSTNTDHPEAGTTSYTFDPSRCELRSVAVTAVGARDLENNGTRVPMIVNTTITHENGGIVLGIEENFDAASNVPGLPCSITSSTSGTRL